MNFATQLNVAPEALEEADATVMCGKSGDQEILRVIRITPTTLAPEAVENTEEILGFARAVEAWLKKELI